MKTRLAAYFASGAVIAAVWLFAIWHPLSEKSRMLGTEMESAKATLGDYQRTIEQLPQFMADRGNLEASRLRLQSSLYAKDDILKLLDHINRRIDSLGLTVVDISPPVSELLKLNRDSYDPTDPNFLNLTYQIKGSFIPFGLFVGVLEEESFFRGVNLCRIQTARDHSTPTQYTIGFRALLGRVGHQKSGEES